MKNQWINMRNGICLLLSFLVFGSCSSSSAENNTEPGTAVEISRPEVHTVEIRQMQFVPAELKVKKGDEVVFVNRDMMAHDVTEQAAKKWNSSMLQNGEYWTLVVNESSEYYCSIHPVMKGKIIME